MKTFLLGVGCQKGGTTWLHRYLSAHPACDFGFRKEYHIFDALWIRGAKTGKFYRGALADLARRARRQAKRQGRETVERSGREALQLEKALQHVSFYTDPENYAEYFDWLHSSRPELQLVGDITPSYNGLPAEKLIAIREMLERRGFHVKVVFLMRDPVERIYSATRMRIRDQQGKPAKQGKEPVAFFNKRFAWGDVEMRTRYEHTFAALDQAFAPEDVLYGFYETLFTDAEVRRITSFLGLEHIDPDFEAQVNASPRTADLDSGSIAKVRAYYDATYQAAMTRFGEDHIRAIWPHA